MSTTDHVIEVFDGLFAGRRDVYSKGYPDPAKENKYRYSKVDGPLNRETLLRHMKGEIVVGVYPLVENRVKWFAVDFDAPKDAQGNVVPDPFPLAFGAAKAQAEVFRRAGLHVYLERSRSGTGVHVWGFLEEWMDAGLVRAAIVPLLTDDKADSRDRLYPVQPSTDALKVGLGNLIALPLNGAALLLGNSAFIDDNGQMEDQRAWLMSVQLNKPAVIERLAEKAVRSRAPAARAAVAVGASYAEGDDERLRPKQPIGGALKLISIYGSPFMRHCWVNRRALPEPMWYAMLGQCTAFEYGRELAHAMSRDYKGYTKAETDAKYDQALEHPPVGCQWVADNYPELACPGVCEHKAPYRHAMPSLLDIASSSGEQMERLGGFGDDLALIKALDAGEARLGIPWGLPGLDDYVRLRNSELTIIGGMSSLGKTSLVIDGAYRIAQTGVPVFLFSAETGRRSLRFRLLSRASKVDSLAIRGERVSGRLNKEELRALEDGAAELARLPIYTDYTSMDADRILMQLESTILREGISLDSPYVVMFDYLQFGARKAGEDSEYQTVTRLAREFKALAKVIDHPAVVLSLVKRENEGDDKPNLTWFKSSGHIEAEMDVGLIITGERGSVSPISRNVTVVKQREGVANVTAVFRMWQNCGLWESSGTSEMQEHAPLIPEHALNPFGEG